MVFVSLLLFLLLTGSPLAGQQEIAGKWDDNWLYGQWWSAPIPKYWKIAFALGQPDTSQVASPIGIAGLNYAMSNRDGRLLFYSNGMNLVDSTYQFMANGQKLNITTFSQYYDEGYPTFKHGMPLPVNKGDTLFRALHLIANVSDSLTIVQQYLFQHDIRFNPQYPDGVVTLKDHIAADGNYCAASFCATRHANGRDWWVALQEHDSNTFYFYLSTPEGVFYSHSQTIEDYVLTQWCQGVSTFSPDGTVFAHHDSQFGLHVFSFDRCSATLSNYRFVDVEYPWPVGDIIISPNSRFLYMMTNTEVLQFDLETEGAAALQASRDTVAVYDTTFMGPGATTFGVAAQGPDGKIYITPPAGSFWFHVIHQPDLPGDSCQFEHRGLALPGQNSPGSMPHFPNYRLGAMTGSPCDSLTTALAEPGPPPVQHLQLQPNPAWEHLDIELVEGLGHTRPWPVRVSTPAGKVVYRGVLPPYAYRHVLSVAGWPSGLYLVQVLDDTGRIRAVGKLVVE